MKNCLGEIGKLLSRMCVIFAVIFVPLYTIGYFAVERGWVFDVGRMYMILLFAFLLSVAGLLFRVKRFPLWRAYVFHFLVSALAYYLIFIQWMGFARKSGVIFLLFLLFVVAYGVYLGVSLAVRRRGTRKKAEETPYQSAFSTKK